MLEISITHYLALSAIVLALGAAVMMTKRNAIGVLIGSELIMNAAMINFAAFGRYAHPGAHGQALGVFAIVIAAAEAAIALAIFLHYYAKIGTVDVDRGAALHG